MSEKNYTIDKISQIMSHIAVRYGVERMYLFDSYARGGATKTSDLDFCLDKGKIKVLVSLCGLYDEYNSRYTKHRSSQIFIRR